MEKLKKSLKELEEEFKKFPMKSEIEECTDPMAAARSLLRISKIQDKIITQQQAVIAKLAKANISLQRILCGDIRL